MTTNTLTRPRKGVNADVESALTDPEANVATESSATPETNEYRESSMAFTLESLLNQSAKRLPTTFKGNEHNTIMPKDSQLSAIGELVANIDPEKLKLFGCSIPLETPWICLLGSESRFKKSNSQLFSAAEHYESDEADWKFHVGLSVAGELIIVQVVDDKIAGINGVWTALATLNEVTSATGITARDLMDEIATITGKWASQAQNTYRLALKAHHRAVTLRGLIDDLA